MQTAPKSVRLHVVFLGRTNVGKSSVINFLAGQSVSIFSPDPGTTTDVVEKAMEMLPYIKKLAEDEDIASIFEFSHEELKFLIGEKAEEMKQKEKKRISGKQKRLF